MHQQCAVSCFSLITCLYSDMIVQYVDFTVLCLYLLKSNTEANAAVMLLYINQRAARVLHIVKVEALSMGTSAIILLQSPAIWMQRRAAFDTVTADVLQPPHTCKHLSRATWPSGLSPHRLVVV